MLVPRTFRNMHTCFCEHVNRSCNFQECIWTKLGVTRASSFHGDKAEWLPHLWAQRYGLGLCSGRWHSGNPFPMYWKCPQRTSHPQIINCLPTSPFTPISTEVEVKKIYVKRNGQRKSTAVGSGGMWSKVSQEAISGEEIDRQLSREFSPWNNPEKTV